ncbi:ATP-binding protein [Rhizobium leguminosarum]
MTFGQVMISDAQLAKASPATRQTAALLAAETGLALPGAKSKPVQPPLAEDMIDLGLSDLGGRIGVDLEKLLDGRLLVQGASGSGKSWTLRRLLEQTHGRVQQVIVDPEGEFISLAEHFDYPILDVSRLDIAALTLAAQRARAHRLSVLLDLSQVDREMQLQAVTAFIIAMIDAPREHWHPALIVIDEAHLFAPFGGQSVAPSSVRKAATLAITDLMSRGRKRGLAGVLATQRLARLAKSVTSEMLNFLIGLNTLDTDIRRAAETIGWDARRAFDRLPVLQAGDFVASGPAFSRSPATMRIGPIVTRHIGARPEIVAPSAVGSATAASLLDLDALMDASEADAAMRDENSLPSSMKSVRAFIRDPAFADAAKIWEALIPLSPGGALVAEIGPYLDMEAGRVSVALALLDAYGVLDFAGMHDDRAVGIAKDMLL